MDAKILARGVSLRVSAMHHVATDGSLTTAARWCYGEAEAWGEPGQWGIEWRGDGWQGSG
ncbi:hypothetical protein E2C01_039006 [Portunus trituberculatus]|uniref:Uncharacterized protein n=1 Tax=Portunus trituberculatus TaxID=210409 RepID=A0A5B7FCG4_PORTR|nr:hypothetical protein [Portunus trituberculatus]